MQKVGAGLHNPYQARLSIMKFGTIVLSLALATSALPALAGPVTVNSGDIAKGEFSHSYKFSFDTAQTFFGSLRTHSKQSHDVHIDWATLGNGIDSFSLSKMLEQESLDGREVVYETWILPSALLSAGEWTLSIGGRDTNKKAVGSYVGSFDAQPASTVPEPQTLALMAAALLAMFATTGRRAKR